MSTIKNTVSKAVKTEGVKPVATKSEEVKPVVPIPQVAVKKPVEKKVAEKKPVEKKVTEKKVAEKKVVEKKPVVKKTTVKKETKKEASVQIALQFEDKNYTMEDLTNSAKDVWVYDHGKALEELKDISLYVKPEENKVYYVFNDTVTGSFNI